MTYDLGSDRSLGLIVKSLREFGYPDMDLAMMREIYASWKEGKRDFNLPHGIIGAMAGRQLDEASELLEEHK